MSGPNSKTTRLVKGALGDFANLNGFVFHKPLILVRTRNEILQIINFDFGLEGFTCDIAIQPLFVPEDNIILSFGNRISRLGVLFPERWSYGKSDLSLIEGLEQIKGLIETNGLEWFGNVDNPKAVVEYIESGKATDPKYIVGFSPHLRWLYHGFCYLWLGQLLNAKRAFKEMGMCLQNDDRRWALRQRQLGEEMCSMLEHEPNQIRKKLEEFATHTRRQIGLK